MRTMSPYGSTALPDTTASTCPVPEALAAAAPGDRLAALEAKREYQRAIQVGVEVAKGNKCAKQETQQFLVCTAYRTVCAHPLLI